jgi:predicted secreted protein
MRRRSAASVAASLALAAATAALPGCGASSSHRSAGGILSIDVPAADGATAPVSVEGRMSAGERLEVRLGASSGTGYAWRLAGPIPALMRMNTGDPAGTVRPADAAKAMPGGPSWTVFGMDAASQGDASMRFVLVRPWEEGVPPARQVDLRVRVDPAPR